MTMVASHMLLLLSALAWQGKEGSKMRDDIYKFFEYLSREMSRSKGETVPIKIENEADSNERFKELDLLFKPTTSTNKIVEDNEIIKVVGVNKKFQENMSEVNDLIKSIESGFIR